MPSVVALDTSLGIIRIQLDPERAPVSTENFLEYVRAGQYDGTIFHRVIPGFMIQGGGMSPDMKEKSTRAPIRNEAGNGLKNDRGTVAMARTQVVDSATSQFFINVADNEFLNHRDQTARGYGYAVFGKVIEGMDIADRIVSVPSGRTGMHENVPKEAVVIRSARIEETE
ncbi:MAG: Peptidyl-prolyl cis-trans isomerase [Armatimonadetes bacterium]|jgi:peptidyl-prolyl cis-trans isomerase B (cyclophilin B)|nr:Peptidyl-prolyl cis-trans isomerase [Armatimonadota bacterium]